MNEDGEVLLSSPQLARKQPLGGNSARYGLSGSCALNPVVSRWRFRGVQLSNQIIGSSC
jgi:hypothetical protein